jgi:orotidine-5'-phosphate decarboxylase
VVRNFMQLLKAKWDEHKFVCVGLDSDAGKLPILHLGLGESDNELLEAQEAYRLAQTAKAGTKECILSAVHRRLLARAQLAFNKRIIDATKDVVCSYKPNAAFYEALGDAGWRTLEKTIQYINKVAPDVPVILDAKRGDTGNTNFGYVMAAAMADAVTVNPYFGREAMKPFMDQKDRGVIVLVRTSNPGAGEFQDLSVHQGIYHDDSGEAIYGPLYQLVARHVVGPWNYNNNCCVVAGATRHSDVAEVRRIVGDNVPILSPGFGKQGADMELAVKAALNKQRQGLIANNSSAILFASSEANFDGAAHAAALKMHEDINIVRETI